MLANEIIQFYNMNKYFLEYQYYYRNIFGLINLNLHIKIKKYIFSISFIFKLISQSKNRQPFKMITGLFI